MPISGFRFRLDGPPLALPPVLDRVAERWSGWPPRARVAAIAVLAVAALALAGRGAVRSPWGPPVEVLLAAHDLRGGQRLTAGDLAATTWPRDLVPPDALDAPGDGVLLGPVPAGTVVTARHLGETGIGEGLPAGRAAYPLPLDQLPPLLPGQVVDLVAGGPDGQGQRLAAAGRVLAVDDTHVWVEVVREEAVGLAGASAFGAVTVVVVSAEASPGP